MIDLESVPCNLCGQTDERILGWKKGALTGHPFRIVECKNCGLIYLNPIPSAEATKRLYDKSYYTGEGFDQNVQYFDEDFLHVDALGFIEDVQTLVKPFQGQKLLDVGCGLGNLLRFATRSGYDCCACDISSFAVETVRKRCSNVKVFHGGIESLIHETDVKFDIITAIEVVEHLRDPKSFFKCITTLLACGGLFAYTTGNAQRMSALLNVRERGVNWGYIHPEGHLYYYTPAVISAYFGQVGLVPLDMYKTPVWRHRGGVNRLFRKMKIEKDNELCNLLYRSLIKTRDILRGETKLPWAIKPFD